MKAVAIKSVDFFRATAPLSGPIADSTHELREIGFIITRLVLHCGVVGESYLLAFHYSRQAILGALHDIASDRTNTIVLPLPTNLIEALSGMVGAAPKAGK